MSGQPMDGHLGTHTMIAVHLYGKTDDYISGFNAGFVDPEFRTVTAATANAIGGDYYRGFLVGCEVRARGARVLANPVSIVPPPVPATGTTAPRKRADSYRDPDLSDRWLAEAEHRANHDWSWRFNLRDSRKIIHRLIAEIRRINKETGR